jgi:hypothetical protein
MATVLTLPIRPTGAFPLVCSDSLLCSDSLKCSDASLVARSVSSLSLAAVSPGTLTLTPNT